MSLLYREFELDGHSLHSVEQGNTDCWELFGSSEGLSAHVDLEVPDSHKIVGIYIVYD